MAEYEVNEGCKFRFDNLDKRMNKIEENQEVLHDMNTNIKLLVQSNGHQDKKIDEIAKTQIEQGKEIKEIKGKPAKDWDKVKWTLITVGCTSLLLFVLSKLPEFFASLG